MLCVDICVCCSWRFTFYLLAFAAGLGALIDVSLYLTSFDLCPLSSCSFPALKAHTHTHTQTHTLNVIHRARVSVCPSSSQMELSLVF